MNKMAAALTYTSQGIPFMLAGEEFARTKVNANGTLNENTLDNFLSKEVQIIVGGTKAWETDDTFRVLS